jgi:hypothetical protein
MSAWTTCPRRMPASKPSSTIGAIYRGLIVEGV